MDCESGESKAKDGLTFARCSQIQVKHWDETSGGLV